MDGPRSQRGLRYRYQRPYRIDGKLGEIIDNQRGTRVGEFSTRVRRCECNHRHARPQARFDTRQSIFEYNAAGRVDTYAFSGNQVDFGVRLTVPDHAGIDDSVEIRA